MAGQSTHQGSGDNWKIVSKDPGATDARAQALFDEASRQAPAAYLNDPSRTPMLPRRATRGRCRLCGTTAQLTKEHLPPKASGNKDRHKSLSLDEWLNRQDLDDTGRGLLQQGGIFGYTLCRPCNSDTGRRYGNAYKRWAELGREALASFPLAQLNAQTGPLGIEWKFGSREDGGLLPGALVRQVLSCMCSLSGPWDLAERHPEIRRIILQQSCEPLPPQLSLGVSFFVGPRGRFAGPQLRVDLEQESWQWMSELAFPPFSFFMVLASSQEDHGYGLMMNDWTRYRPDEEKLLEGLFEIGFGWTIYPGDYRTRAAIEAARAQ